MQNRLLKEIIFRSGYLVVAVVAFFLSLGFWSVGGGSEPNGFNPYFFTNYFVWVIVMSIVATAGALVEDVKIFKGGDFSVYTKKFPFLKFCTLSSMLFCLLMGAFFVDRIGEMRLTDSTSYGSIYPGIATAGYWLDATVFFPFFVCPVLYITMYVLFEEKGKSRKIYGSFGIVPPTVFYLTDKIFGIVMKAVYGGNDALLAAGKYGVANPFFFYDGVTYHQWWWILLWPSIFGVGLMLLNRSSFLISRLKRDENGKIVFIKGEPNEDEMCDLFHPIVVKRRLKKANKIKK
ncbi:MAG: hypothetical protein IJ676_02050 [Clostridia bacterium]|nr:hypothetical protein [Clostridia bacterium]